MIYIPPLEEEVDSTQVEDGGVLKIFACVFIQTPSPVRVLPLIQEGELFTLFLNLPDSNIIFYIQKKLLCPSAFAMRMLWV